MIVFLLDLSKSYIALRRKCPNKDFFSATYLSVFSPDTGKYGPENLQCCRWYSCHGGPFFYLKSEALAIKRSLDNEKDDLQIPQKYKVIMQFLSQKLKAGGFSS